MKIFKNTIVVVLIALSFYSCEKWPGVKCCADPPPFSIYKTKGDYFHYYSTWLDKKGRVSHLLDVDKDEAIVYHYEGFEGYHLRIKLDSGYLLGGEITPNDVFTGLTFSEYNELFDRGELTKLDSLLENNIIDNDPFTDYYSLPFYEVFNDSVGSLFWDDSLSHKETDFRQLAVIAKEINQIIAEGKLEEHFKKIK